MNHKTELQSIKARYLVIIEKKRKNQLINWEENNWQNLVTYLSKAKLQFIMLR